LSLIDQFEVQFNELSNFELSDGSLSEVQPVELAGMLNQEINRVVNQIDSNALITHFNIYLSSHDYTRLEKYKSLIIDGLLDLVNKTAELKRIEIFNNLTITTNKDSALNTGIIKCIPVIEIIPDLNINQYVFFLEIAGMKKQLDEKTYIIGRGTDVDIQLNDSGVSRKHVEIEINDFIYIKDLNSTNGTFINGEKIDEHSANDEVVFKIGASEIKIYRDQI
jgi:hypothetical protein